MSKTEIAWLAGIVEGEGFIGIHSTKKKPGSKKPDGYRYKTPCIEVAMNDRDVIARVAALFGKPVLGPYQYGKLATRPHYQAQVFGKEAAHFLRLILPHLGKRRAKAANRAIRLWERKWNSSK